MFSLLLSLLFWSCSQTPEEIDRANALLSSGDTVAAMKIYEQIILEDPGSEDALESETHLRDIFLTSANGLREQDPEKANKFYRIIMKRWKNSSEALQAKQAIAAISDDNSNTEALPPQLSNNEIQLDSTSSSVGQNSKVVQGKLLTKPVQPADFKERKPLLPNKKSTSSKKKRNDHASELDELTIKCVENQAICKKRLIPRYKELVSKGKRDYLLSVFYTYSKNTLKSQKEAIKQAERHLDKLHGQGVDVTELQNRLRQRCSGCEQVKANFAELALCKNLIAKPNPLAIADYKRQYPNGACKNLSASSNSASPKKEEKPSKGVDN